MTCNYLKNINAIIAVTWDFEICFHIVKTEFHYVTLSKTQMYTMIVFRV